MGYLLANFLLFVFTTLNLIYDVFTLPIYYCLQNPAKRRRLINKARAKAMVVSNTEILYQAEDSQDSPFVRQMDEKGVDTLVKLFELSYSDPKKAAKPLLGTRKVVRMEKEKDSASGKQFTKFVLGDYEWITMKEVAENARHFGLGLRSLQIAPRSNVSIFADTRAEWLIAARGCFQHSMTLCTLYTNLGMEAIQYGVSLTESQVIITSQELLPKVAKCLEDLPTVTMVVVFEEPWRGQLPSSITELNDQVSSDKVSLISYSEVIRLGQKSARDDDDAFYGESKQFDALPSPDDPAIIMFTSGSTGTPKGVVLTHSNIVSAFKSVLNFLFVALSGKTDLDNEVYIAFLPLAHILEFLAENVILVLGVKIGYSSPYTLMDNGTAIKKGTKGDLTTLRPTFMSCVPVILDRIYKGILAKIKSRGDFTYKLFDYAVSYRALWKSRGYETPLFDRFLFRAVRDVTGGRLIRIVAGGAPLNATTHQFIRHVLGVDLMQGYGLTETCSTGSIMDVNDVAGVEVVGPPLTNVDIKLRSWEEGNYTIHDSIGPRGEIIVGGKHIAQGYFKNDEATAESFEADGEQRWFQTGDIGQMMPNGNLKIIDRKKDLVKLQAGEYVSLGKVEGVLKLHPMIESVCVCARSTESFCVAIIVPSKSGFVDFSHEVCHKSGFTAEQLASDQSVLDGVAKSMLSFGVSKGLEKFEIPRKFAVVFDDWTPDSGLVTAAMKLRRKPVEEKYAPEIQRLYNQLNNNNSDRSAVKFKDGKVSPA